MQFHLNGVRTGEPAAAEAAMDLPSGAGGEALPATIGVLIVGCGPAGLTLATQLAAFPAIHTRVARASRNQDVEDHLSEMPHTILNQARSMISICRPCGNHPGACNRTATAGCVTWSSMARAAQITRCR